MKAEELNKMTAQEACDYSVMKIVEQGERCFDAGEGSCVYENNKGQHCAIGWLLDENREHFMNFNGTILEMDEEFYLPELIQNNLELFRLLQHFHDAKTCHWRMKKLLEIEKYGIDTSGLQWRRWVDIGE